MMTLFGALHAIAAQRGDGLHPKLLKAITRSTAWPVVERAIETAEHRERPERVAGDNGTVPKPTLRIVGPSAE